MHFPGLWLVEKFVSFLEYILNNILLATYGAMLNTFQMPS